MSRLRRSLFEATFPPPSKYEQKSLHVPFALKPKSLDQPGLLSVETAFRFSLLQQFFIAAFSFYNFASVSFLKSFTSTARAATSNLR